ncbi:hypothetical protein J7J13_03345 [bacterium]|nr:hypothetical protein [bacterium]
MKKKKETSIDDLAIMIKKSFDYVEKRFNGVDKRFNNVDKRFDKVEKRLDNLEAGQEEIKQKFNFTVHRFELKELEYELRNWKSKADKNILTNILTND